MKKVLTVFSLVAFLSMGVTPALAGPALKFSPSSGSYSNGSTFKVTITVDSETQKSAAVDAYGTFDSSKLEVVSIDAAAVPAFPFSMGKDIFNTDGRFQIYFSPTSDTVISEAPAIKGDLAVVTFRAKSVGTAEVKFTCASGSTLDSNIFNIEGVDVIDCASNVNGLYTISSSGGTTVENTPVPTATAVPTSTTSSSTTTSTTTSSSSTTTTGTELPRTGAVETTIGILIFGIVGIMAGFFLKWL